MRDFLCNNRTKKQSFFLQFPNVKDIKDIFSAIYQQEFNPGTINSQHSSFTSKILFTHCKSMKCFHISSKKSQRSTLMALKEWFLPKRLELFPIRIVSINNNRMARKA